MADVGTGSGAIALALKAERPDLEVVATELSPGALAVARANAARLGLDVELLEGDLLEPVDGRLDAVVSNPPYVAAGDQLPPEVGATSRARRCSAGADGLDVIRRLIAGRRRRPASSRSRSARARPPRSRSWSVREAGPTYPRSATWPATSAWSSAVPLSA